MASYSNIICHSDSAGGAIVRYADCASTTAKCYARFSLEGNLSL